MFMNEDHLVARTLRVSIAAVLMMLISIVLLLMLTPTAVADDVTWGDRVIAGIETYSWTNITLDGNLTVEGGGNLTLEHGRLQVNATSEGQYQILVEEGGTLVLWNVSMTSAGGTYGIEVRGVVEYEEGTVEGLEKEHHVPTVPRGFVVFGNGTVLLTDVDVINPFGYALYINDTGGAYVEGGHLYGSSTAVRVNDHGVIAMFGTEIGVDKGSDLVILMGSAILYAEDCRFDSDDVYSGSIHDVALFILGDGVEAVLFNSTITTTELAVMNGGYLEVTGSTFEPDRLRGLPDLNARNADIYIENITMREALLSGCDVELRDSTYSSGDVNNASTLYTYGPVPPLSSLADDTVLHHHYWVDFLLLNRTGEPEAGMVLTVLTSEGGLVVSEAISAEDGMVMKVPVRSWTLVGDHLTYEPSHRIEFGETSYQISNLQVYDNITVTLWDMEGSYDLVLDTDSVTPSIPAPEENRTFDIIVDGGVLVPKPWDAGSTSIILYIDGVLHERGSFSLTNRQHMVFQDLDLRAGTHTFRIVVDPDDSTEEMNEGGNDEVRFLLDVAPEGGTGELVDLTAEIDRIGDTAGTSGEELISGVIFVDYTVRAYNSKILMRNVRVVVFVDDVMDDLVRVDLTDAEDDHFRYTSQFRLNLPRGEYVIKVVVDPYNEIDEEREHNNEDQVTVTLNEDVGDNTFFDDTCCISLVIFGLVAAVGILGAWAQRKQRMAAEQAGTSQYAGMATAQPSMSGSQTYGTEPSYQYTHRPAGREPVSLDERLAVEQSGAAYTADDWEEGVAGRIAAPPERSTPTRERYQATDLTCPRCTGRDILGFSDGSAKCQSCKKIFYPGRR